MDHGGQTQETEMLYVKRKGRYRPWGNTLVNSDQRELDPMQVGSCRLTYNPEPGWFRYIYDVTPDTAAFLAAAEIARFAMEQAVAEAARSTPMTTTTYTEQQQEIIERFRAELASVGASLPIWWNNASAHSIARAGIEAVQKSACNELQQPEQDRLS